MIRRILLALALIAFMAMPAMAAVQNIKVSGEIESTWLVRDQFDLGFNSTTQSQFYQNLLITQAILRVDADLTDNVSAVIQLLNEREWGDEDETADSDQGVENTTEVDVDLAYITLAEMLYSPLTVIVGRQPLRYGNAFIIGEPDGARSNGRLGVVASDQSKRKAFDAIRAVFDYDPLTIDIIAAKIDQNVVLGALGDEDDDIDLYGIYSTWQLQDDRNTSVESYFFAKIDSSQQQGAGTSGHKDDVVYTQGIRIESNLIDDMWTSAELALQSGVKTNAMANGNAVDGTTVDNMKREALAFQFISNYAIPDMAYDPIISGSYTLLSGDSNPQNTSNNPFQNSSEKWTQWDTMYEDQNAGRIYDVLFSPTNCHIYNIGIQVTPLEDLVASINWTGLWLQKELDKAASSTTDLPVGQPDGTTIQPVVTVDETALGYEIDFDLMYAYTEDVNIGFTAGWYFPGDVFGVLNNDTAKQFITNVDVKF